MEHSAVANSDSALEFCGQTSISLVLPTLGRVDVSNLLRLVDSLVSHDLRFFLQYELIVVFNGCSKTGWYSALSDAFSSDDRLILLHQPVRGIVHALNYGIASARYDYIVRQDDDDASYPGRILFTCAHLAEASADVAFCNALVLSNGRSYVWRKPVPLPLSYTLCFYNPFVHATMVVRRSLLIRAGGYQLSNGHEDLDLFVRMRMLGAKFSTLSAVLYEYRVSNSVRGDSYGKLLSSVSRSLVYIASLVLALRPSILILLVWPFAVLFVFATSFLRLAHLLFGSMMQTLRNAFR